VLDDAGVSVCQARQVAEFLVCRGFWIDAGHRHD
jgi:hypothetical protein